MKYDGASVLTAAKSSSRARRTNALRILDGIPADMRDHREPVRRAGCCPGMEQREPLLPVSEWHSPVVPVMNTVRMPLAARNAACTARLRSERAVGVKGRVRRRHQLVKRTNRVIINLATVRKSGAAGSAAPARSRSTAALAKTPKMPNSGTWRSRSTPKPQSAKPPQLMLTRFMMP